MSREEPGHMRAAMRRAGRAPVWGVLVLGAVLLALPAASAEKCESACVASSSEVMQQCMARCPDPASKKSAYAYCTKNCSEHYEVRFAECKKECPKEKPDYGRPSPRMGMTYSESGNPPKALKTAGKTGKGGSKKGGAKSGGGSKKSKRSR